MNFHTLRQITCIRFPGVILLLVVCVQSCLEQLHLDCKEIPRACRQNFQFWREVVHLSRRYYLCVDLATNTASVYSSRCLRVDTQTGVRFTTPLSIGTLCSDPAYRFHDNGLKSHVAHEPKRQKDISDVDNGSLPRDKDADDAKCVNKTDCSNDDVGDNGTIGNTQTGKSATSGSHAASESSSLPSVPLLPTVAMVVISIGQAW